MCFQRLPAEILGAWHQRPWLAGFAVRRAAVAAFTPLSGARLICGAFNLHEPTWPFGCGHRAAFPVRGVKGAIL